MPLLGRGFLFLAPGGRPFLFSNPGLVAEAADCGGTLSGVLNKLLSNEGFGTLGVGIEDVLLYMKRERSWRYVLPSGLLEP